MLSLLLVVSLRHALVACVARSSVRPVFAFLFFCRDVCVRAGTPRFNFSNTTLPVLVFASRAICAVRCANTISSNLLCAPSASMASVLVLAKRPKAFLYTLRITQLSLFFSAAVQLRYAAT
uniref:Putative secreted protein n=1 Tax=Ixodes ricinus TaxID=34613 RepID=A0A147BB65_IXORI